MTEGLTEGDGGRVMAASVDDRSDRHAVVGAGFCGLGVAAAFQRRGIPYDQIEADDDVGGNWYHGVYETVHIISSRRTTEYSDFPMPGDWPDFPSAGQMLTYLRDYADHHDLRAHIELNTGIQHVEPADRGRWLVTLTNGARRLYGGVVLATGHHWDKRFPDYPGDFSGEIIHSKDYKRPDVMAGKHVLVVGGGNSACDIAVEAARFAASAHISMRRGYWFMPKTLFGVPTVEMLKPWMPIGAQRAFMRGLLKIVVGDYERYGLERPTHRIFERHPTINSELLHNLRHGRITPHPDVRRYDGDHVEFVDGQRARADLVVCATGYHVSFPFVADGIVNWDERGMPDLINGMLPRRHRNLYFFGTGQPRYGAGPLISAGAQALSTMVQVQPKLKHPIGAVLERMGSKPPTSWLQDPHRLLRDLRRGRAILPRLPQIERVLMP